MRKATSPPTVFACGCCGKEITRAFGAGLYISPDNRMTEYMLCGHCAAERDRDPDAVNSCIELRLAGVKGHA